MNPDVSSWNTANVTLMNGTFSSTSINPDLSSWDFSSATDLVNFLDGSGITTANYDNFIIQLEATATESGVTVDAAGVNNTTAVSGTAKSNLEGNGWVFNDGGGI